MTKPRFTIVTATAGAEKYVECVNSWERNRAVFPWGEVHVFQRELGSPHASQDTAVMIRVPDYLGPVPAFKLGVDLALQITAPDGVIACLHDDLLIEEESWDAKVMAFFNQHPEVGLVGFGGGTGLGSADIYQVPYSPMQLARQDFVSNMREAEAHGRRVTVPTRVACLDGFSQIGRVKYWQGHDYPSGVRTMRSVESKAPLSVLTDHGVVHHMYDGFLGASAIERGWQVYMLPIACHHYGGQTAVADAGYQAWANAQNSSEEDGDGKFWVRSHATVYDLLRGVLPLRF